MGLGVAVGFLLGFGFGFGSAFVFLKKWKELKKNKNDFF